MHKKSTGSVWYDKKADFLEVIFEKKTGYFRETSHNQVMEKVDRQGHVIGFHVLGVNQMRKPVEVCLARPLKRRPVVLRRGKVNP